MGTSKYVVSIGMKLTHLKEPLKKLKGGDSSEIMFLEQTSIADSLFKRELVLIYAVKRQHC